jgi:Tol biopolymer transport system component
MISGKRAFPGSTHASLIASILKEKAPPLAGPLDRVVQTCLEKDPDKRWQSAREVKHALEWIAQETPAASTAPTRRQWLWPTVAALVVAGAAVGWNWYRASRLSDLPLVRQDVDLGADIALNPPVAYVTNVVISPDGTRLAYVASTASGGPVRLFTRRLDQPKAVDLQGTEGVRGPFFSPDGRWLGFASGRKLYKISVDGGAVVALMDLSAAFAGASWSEDSIVVAQNNTPLARIPTTGGQATPVLEFADGEHTQASPQFLPGGTALLFSGNVLGGPENATVDVVSLSDHHRKMLAHGAFPRYVPSYNGTGHLLYTFKGALYAIPFDPNRLETRGAAVPILDDVMGSATVAGKFDVSQTGALVYQQGAGTGLAMPTVQWLDSMGKQELLLAKPGLYSTLRLSPDGKRLAVTVQDSANRDILVYEWQHDRTNKLTFGGVYDNPVWTPDGQYVVFRSPTAAARMLWARADGSGQPQQLTQGKPTQQIPWSFSPVGNRLAFVENSQIWTVSTEERDGQLKAGTPERFLKTQFEDTEPMFSPDGRWLAYTSAEAGKATEVYVRPFPPPASGPGGQWVVSTGGGQGPVWSSAGRELLYRSPEGLMAVSYTVSGDKFTADKPRLWSAKVTTANFSLAPDGKRVAVVMLVQGAEAPKPEHEVVFLENFFDELRRKVPAGK